MTSPGDPATDPLKSDAAESETIDSIRAVILVAMSVVSVFIGYLTSILVARLLGPIGFEQYAVAIATLGLLATLAEAGVGKYALKVLPGFAVSKQWHLASGYWRFSLRTVLLVSMVIAVIIAAWEGIEDGEFGDYPLGVAILFLPVVALAGAGVDFVMANRAAITGALIARIVVPCTTLAALAIFMVTKTELSPSIAVLCFAGGSTVGAILCLFAFRKTSPDEYFSAEPQFQRNVWLRQSLAFAVFAFMSSWLVRISLIVLELLPVEGAEVGVFAAALETGCLILLLSKSTDKLFQPQMSIVIERTDWQMGTRLRWQRFAIVGTGCALFLLTMLLFGKSILGLYGPEFVSGYPALCFVTVGACVWTMFSLAPAFLRFIGKNTFVLVTTGLAGIALVVATVGLGNQYGATGAGAAFCILISVLMLTFLVHASRHFAKFEYLDASDVEPPLR